MRWIERGWMMIPVAVAVVGVSCGDGGTAPTGANVQFVIGDIDLQAGRDTVVQISNTGGSAIGPIQLVPLPVRDSAGGVVSGPSLQVNPSDIATLNPGATVSAALSVVVPANTPNGDYQVGLEARSQNQLLASALLRFRVTNGTSGPPANSVAITSGPTAFIRGDVVQFTAEVRDSAGTVLPTEPVQWSVGGFGLFDATGQFVSYSTGAIDIIAQSGTGADTLSVTVADRTLSGTFSTLGHGVVDQAPTTDLWVHGGVLYSGTWNGGGGTFYAWSLANPDQPVKTDSLVVDARSVNDVKIRSDGTLGVITHEGSSDGLNGVSLLDLTVPEHPTIITRYTTGLAAGVHNAWIEGNYLYLVTDGTDPMSGGLRVIDVTNPAAPTQVAQFFAGGISRNPLHDVYLRDGLAFL
ncbi:MAG: NEW3 domain-containing protein, partial [Gemmatimonadetes bacterium]|nr:NEW3 domain-containing protein [Gemmatimonadota bacterium]